MAMLLLSPVPPPDMRWQDLFKELQTIQRSIYDLRQHLNDRFDFLENILRNYIVDSTGRLQQLQIAAKQSNIDSDEIKKMLSQIESETYGNYLMTSGFKWLDVEKCLSQGRRMTEELFIECRNEMAWFAKTGLSEAGLVEVEPQHRGVLGSIYNRLTHSNASIPDPNSWLMGARTLIRLGYSYPQFTYLIGSPTKSRLNISLDDLIKQGKFFSEIFRRMAFENSSAESPSLNTKLLNAIKTNYRTAIENALEKAQSLPASFMAGTPNPKVDLKDQPPSRDPGYYDFMQIPIQPCDSKLVHVGLWSGKIPRVLMKIMNPILISWRSTVLPFCG